MNIITLTLLSNRQSFYRSLVHVAKDCYFCLNFVYAKNDHANSTGIKWFQLYTTCTIRYYTEHPITYAINEIYHVNSLYITFMYST